MTASHIAATILNANRTKRTDKVFTWLDLHPMQSQTQKRGASGAAVIAHAAAMSSGEWSVLPGYEIPGVTP